jgi:hypothetical protein
MGRTTETFNGQIAALKVNIEALAKSMTGGLTEGIKSFVAGMNKAVKEVNDDLNSEPLRSFLPIFGKSLLSGGSATGMVAGCAGFRGQQWGGGRGLEPGQAAEFARNHQ